MKLLYIFVIVLVITSCKNEAQKLAIDDTYKENWTAFLNAKTKERQNDYLQLIALKKLDSNSNTFGSDKSNDFVFEIKNLPKTIGTVYMSADSLVFEAAENTIVKTTNSDTITQILLELDEYGSSQKLVFERISWQIITRSGQHYLRVWDDQNPTITDFKGYEWFDLNPNFILNGQFTYFPEIKSEIVKAEVDGKRSVKFIGQVSFNYNNETYTLDVGQSGFTMVGDDTSGDNTYGGGRYMYLDLPEDNGAVTVDFNTLYNPPCAFSEFTTCLYPPRQNVLPFELTAGETINLIH